MMPIRPPARLSWPTFISYLAAAIGGLALIIGFARFNALHQQFLSTNFDAVHGARTLIKARFFVDKAATDIDTALVVPDQRMRLLASASRHLLAAETYAAEGRDGDPDTRKALAALIREARNGLHKTQGLPANTEALLNMAAEMHSLTNELGNVELDRWGNLSALNTELTSGMRMMNQLIGATFVLLVAIMLTLAWTLRRTRIAETALKHAKSETEAIQQTTLDASPIGIAFIDITHPGNHRILTANQQMAGIFGHDPGSLPGSGLRPLFVDDRAYEQFSQTAAEQLAKGSVMREEALMLHRNGSSFWCALSAKAIDPMNIGRGVVLTCEDINERKLAAAELKREHQRAEAANEAKSEFLANMSHELRTPFTGLIGLLNLLDYSQLDERQRRHLQLARDSASHMQVIVDDILDFSKIEAGKLFIESAPFDLHQLLSITAEMHSATARRKGLDFLFDLAAPSPCHVIGDPVRLRQIFDNLLSNAIKFTSQGEIRLHARTRTSDGRLRLHIVVEDTGIGIAPEMQARIFDKFTQADSSTTRLYGGSGLGLTISDQLARRMGGRIRLRSQPGMGSRFSLSLWLPLASDERPDNSATARCTERLDGISILLAEDNEINRVMLAELLTEAGASVHSAADGETAVRMAAECKPDVILMDCQMPRVDGLEATRRIRLAESPGKQVPIIALTAFSSTGFRDDCLAAGMDRYLTKPVSPSLLFSEIIQLLACRENPRTVPQPMPEAAAPPLFCGRLLLVDDNLPILEATAALLERAGCTVITAENGMAALARLDEEFDKPADKSGTPPGFDLILLDCQMPLLDGMETTRRWRAKERERHLPRQAIVALTAEDRHLAEARCHEAGMDDVLSKPFTEKELHALLAEWLH